MSSAINHAIESLTVAAECGGELDLEMYQESRDRLVEIRDAIEQYDQRLNAGEKSPDGDDYNALRALLGLIG